MWLSCMQDTCGKKEQIPKNTYRQSKMPALGPKEEPIYYDGLTSIAVDLIKKFRTENEIGVSGARCQKTRRIAK